MKLKISKGKRVAAVLRNRKLNLLIKTNMEGVSYE